MPSTATDGGSSVSSECSAGPRSARRVLGVLGPAGRARHILPLSPQPADINWKRLPEPVTQRVYQITGPSMHFDTLFLGRPLIGGKTRAAGTDTPQLTRGSGCFRGVR